MKYPIRPKWFAYPAFPVVWGMPGVGSAGFPSINIDLNHHLSIFPDGLIHTGWPTNMRVGQTQTPGLVNQSACRTDSYTRVGQPICVSDRLIHPGWPTNMRVGRTHTHGLVNQSACRTDSYTRVGRPICVSDRLKHPGWSTNLRVGQAHTPGLAGQYACRSLFRQYEIMNDHSNIDQMVKTNNANKRRMLYVS